MFKKQSGSDEPELDDAFDDTCISTPIPRQVRGKSYSLADTPRSPPLRHHVRSCSSLFSNPSLTGSPGFPSRYSSTSSVHSFRYSSTGSLGSLGPSSTPDSVPEFVIPKRTTPPRPPTLTSNAEILSQIDGKKVKGYHSVIVREMRGELSPGEHFERPVCRGISSLDLNFASFGSPKSCDDSFSDFKF